MKIIDQLTMYVLVFIVILIILCLALAVGFLLHRNKKEKSLTENENFRESPVADAEKFLPFDDIDDDMIVVNGRKRFVAIIRCRGFDFYAANSDEKIRTKNNYRSFIKAFSSRITYRLYGEDINMDQTMSMYQETYSALQELAFNESENYKQAREAFEAIRGSENPEKDELEMYLLTTAKKLNAYKWRLNHMESQMRYINRVSGPASGRQRLVQTYVVNWKNRDEIITGLLSDAQLHKKAQIELDKICRNKIRQLNDTGVKAYRCKTSELIEMFYRHTHPVSGNRYKIEGLEHSSYYDMVSTTNSLDEMDEDYENELVGEIMMGGDQFV